MYKNVKYKIFNLYLILSSFVYFPGSIFLFFKCGSVQQKRATERA